MKNKNGIISKIEKGIIFVMVLSFFFSSILSVNVVKASEVNSQINNSENVTDNVDTNENDELTNEEEKNDIDNQESNNDEIISNDDSLNEENEATKTNEDTKTNESAKPSKAPLVKSVDTGDFTVEGGTIDKDYSFSDGVLTILTSTQLTIKNTNIATATSNRIVVPEDVSANLIFAGVNIRATTNAPFTLTPDSNNDGEGASASIIIADGTENTLVSAASSYPGLRCGKTTSLTIDDGVVNKDINGNEIVPKLGRVPNDVTLLNGTKLKKGDRLTKLDSSNVGTLNVTGSTYAAGIGGGNGEDGGNITINGGLITASSSGTGDSLANAGAGIGGGNYAAGGNITINSGIITANGAYHAAGVGGGYCTSSSTYPVNISPAVVDKGTGKAKSGNITINGGLTYSNGGTHGDAFGDGCYTYTTSEKYTILVTGGTVIPKAGSGRFDLGGTQADVIVLGGSLKASKFKSIEGSVAYGDMDKTTKVFMTEISLKSFGIDKVGTTLVDDIDMKINGVHYNYGVPSYTDSEGNLYFWLPDTNKGAEVSVDLDVLDKQTGEAIKTDTFFAKDVGTGSNVHLKQYVIFNVDQKLDDSLIKKRYDGLGLNDSEIKAQVAAMEIETTLPEGGKLTNASKMEISSQLLEDDGETVADDAEIVQGSNPNAGKYQLIITSTEYADLTTDGFNDAYWGHRAYYKYAEITPADTQTKLTVSGVEVKDGKLSPGSDITLSAMVRPKDGEATTCASPKGYVQFYINGQKYGDPVKVTEHVKDTTSDNYNYSTAQINWKPIDSNIANVEEIQEIKAVYIGEDPNYTTSEGAGEIKLSFVDVDTDEDGNPDVNIDVDGDGIPDINIDTDRDWKPDVNVDIDGDKKPDVNIDTDNSGTWKPSTEGGNEDGIWKPDTSLDTNGDGKVDEDHIYRPGYDIDKDGVDDSWNPDKDVDLDGDDKPEYDTSNPGINIDTDGDGNPDINIDVDGDGIPDINIDTDVDGLPDVNIDLNGDKLPEINVDTDNSGTWKPSGEGGNGDGIWKPDTSLDTNGDGKVDIEHGYRPGYDFDKDGVDDSWNPDKNVDKDKDGNSDYDTSNPNINVDTDGDGKPDINIDTDKDGNPDVNVDTDGDGKPDINVDVDGDKIPDINVDTNEDGYPDINVDTDGDKKPDINIDTDNSGTWKPSTDGGNEDGVWKPDTDIDTDGDGEADVDHLYRDPVDEDGDGVDDYWKPTIIVPEDGDRIAYGTGDIFYIDSVKTSDENNMGLYMLLSFISLAGVIGIGIGLKRKQSNL